MTPPPSLHQSTAWLKSLPNKLTLGRIAVIPLLLLLYPIGFSKLNVFCAVLFAAAAITDYFDGYLARKYGNVTPLGSLLDPIADKMLVAAALVLLAGAGVIHPFLAALLIGRDIAVNGIRLLAMEQGFTIAVSEFGKWKTAVMSVAIGCLLVNQPAGEELFGWPWRVVGMISLWISVGLSLYSAYLYGAAYLEKAKVKLVP